MAKNRTTQSFAAAAQKIEDAYRQIDERVPSGIRIVGEEVMTDVRASRPGHGVPVDTGALRSTGRVTGPDNGVVRLSFGGAAAPYALKQHEGLELRHTVGEARYLVRGLQRWKPDGSAAIAALKANAEAGLKAASR